jgi:hypothetical protein
MTIDMTNGHTSRCHPRETVHVGDGGDDGDREGALDHVWPAVVELGSSGGSEAQESGD